MIESIRQFAFNTATFNSLVGILLYWVPTALCIVGYTVRTFRNVQTDVKRRKECEVAERMAKVTETRSCSYYTPTDTIGSLLGRALVSILPIANLWAAMFDVAPIMFKRIFDLFDKVFNQPLVPPRKEGS